MRVEFLTNAAARPVRGFVGVRGSAYKYIMALVKMMIIRQQKTMKK